MVQGRAEGMLEIAIGLVKDGLITIKEASDRIGISPEEFEKHLLNEDEKQDLISFKITTAMVIVTMAVADFVLDVYKYKKGNRPSQR